MNRALPGEYRQALGFAAVSGVGVPRLSPDRCPPKSKRGPVAEGPASRPYGDGGGTARIEVHGWVTAGGNWSTPNYRICRRHTGSYPTHYSWTKPSSRSSARSIGCRPITSTWGFHSVHLDGIDYRYTTAGGWFSQQLLYHNSLYGYDPVEQYVELYIPRIFEGMVIRVGRWIACPDIETQYAPDNYLATHSLLFTYDSYTQTGVRSSFQLNERNMVQGAIQSGTDMAPWYAGALRPASSAGDGCPGRIMMRSIPVSTTSTTASFVTSWPTAAKQDTTISIMS